MRHRLLLPKQKGKGHPQIYEADTKYAAQAVKEIAKAQKRGVGYGDRNSKKEEQNFGL